MKVMLVNGSPNENGCTRRALRELQQTFHEQEIETEIFWIGSAPLNGCRACWYCEEHRKCALKDKVNEFHQIADDADGYIFASPVHYASAAGMFTAFMDRVFMTEQMNGGAHFRLKPAAAVVSARRAGTTASLDQINKYFTILEMPIISSTYWNMVHGTEEKEVEKDLEGLQTMRHLARNMSYYIKCREAAKLAGVAIPRQEPSIGTNFIR